MTLNAENTYTRFQNYAIRPKITRVDMSVYVKRSRSLNCFQLRVLRFVIDVYAFYALFKKVSKDFQDILVIIIATFKHNKIIEIHHHS
jgi:hypothetical protein